MGHGKVATEEDGSHVSGLHLPAHLRASTLKAPLALPARLPDPVRITPDA